MREAINTTSQPMSKITQLRPRISDFYIGQRL